VIRHTTITRPHRTTFQRFAAIAFADPIATLADVGSYRWPVESEAAIAYDTLDRLLAGPGVCGMPARYHRPCQETGPASPRM
jgi:hypothetical protein